MSGILPIGGGTAGQTSIWERFTSRGTIHPEYSNRKTSIGLAYLWVSTIPLAPVPRSALDISTWIELPIWRIGVTHRTNFFGRSIMYFSLLRLLFLGLMMSFATGYSRAQTARDLNVSDRERSSSAVARTTSMNVLDDKRSLQIGDRLSMRVVEDRKPPLSLIVTDSGEVEVPLIGRVQAKGKTCKQLAYAIKEPLQREYYYKATVIIGLDLETLKSPGRVYVTGQVRNQGPLDIPPDETFTVSRAIIRAGGFADFANKRRVRLVRKDGDKPKTIIVDLELVIKKGQTDKDPVVEPDDTIIVPERLINF